MRGRVFVVLRQKRIKAPYVLTPMQWNDYRAYKPRVVWVTQSHHYLAPAFWLPRPERL